MILYFAVIEMVALNIRTFLVDRFHSSAGQMHHGSAMAMDPDPEELHAIAKDLDDSIVVYC